jgi:hypothetical protein
MTSFFLFLMASRFINFYVQAALSFTPDANCNLVAIQMKATNISNNMASLEFPRDQNRKGIDHPLGLKHSQRTHDSIKIFTNEGVPTLPLFFLFSLLGKETYPLICSNVGL